LSIDHDPIYLYLKFQNLLAFSGNMMELAGKQAISAHSQNGNAIHFVAKPVSTTGILNNPRPNSLIPGSTNEGYQPYFSFQDLFDANLPTDQALQLLHPFTMNTDRRGQIIHKATLKTEYKVPDVAFYLGQKWWEEIANSTNPSESLIRIKEGDIARVYNPFRTQRLGFRQPEIPAVLLRNILEKYIVNAAPHITSHSSLSWDDIHKRYAQIYNELNPNILPLPFGGKIFRLVPIEHREIMENIYSILGDNNEPSRAEIKATFISTGNMDNHQDIVVEQIISIRRALGTMNAILGNIDELETTPETTNIFGTQLNAINRIFDAVFSQNIYNIINDLHLSDAEHILKTHLPDSPEYQIILALPDLADLLAHPCLSEYARIVPSLPIFLPPAKGWVRKEGVAQAFRNRGQAKGN
jgi:hypothetical protein